MNAKTFEDVQAPRAVLPDTYRTLSEVRSSVGLAPDEMPD